MILRLYEKKVINKMIYYRNTKRLSPILGRDGIRVMAEKITIQKDDVMNAYKQASREERILLERIFKEMFPPKDITERIKTFEDACNELGETNELVQAYRTAESNTSGNQKDVSDVVAYLKLRIIAAALNEGWKPNFDGDECRYYPWFYIYTKKEYEELDEDEKKECRVVYRSFSSASASGGVVYASVGGASSYSDAGYGSRLSFKTREIAEYFGKQFIDIWAEFLFA